MAITNLTGTSWILKSGSATISNIFPYYSTQGTQNLSLVTNLGSYLTLVTSIWTDGLGGHHASSTLKAGETTLGSASAYNQYAVVSPPSSVTISYTTNKITITGGSAVTDSTLIAWFEQFATFVPETMYLATETDLGSIADSIRAKTGLTAPLSFPSGFTSAISTMVVPSGNQDITTLSEYDVSAKATARVSSAERDKIIASNIKSGVSILGVSGSLPVPTGNINITSTASVDVTNYATAQVVDANLLAENIKNGVTILGITGTASGGTLPTMFAPSWSFSVSDGERLSRTQNGSFVEYYDIYKQSDDSLLASIPASGSEFTNLTNTYVTNFPVGTYNVYAKSRATNFNDSSAQVLQDFKCYSITDSLTNLTESSGITKFINGDFTLTLIADTDYSLPSSIDITYINHLHSSVTVTLTSGTLTYLTDNYGANGFRATYTQGTGTIVFENGNGMSNITITAVGESGANNITINFNILSNWYLSARIDLYYNNQQIESWSSDTPEPPATYVTSEITGASMTIDTTYEYGYCNVTVNGSPVTEVNESFTFIPTSTDTIIVDFYYED